MCMKCTSTGDDDSTDFWIKRSVVQREMYSDDENDDDGENWKLLRPKSTTSEYSSVFEKHQRSSETVFDVANIRNPFDESSKSTNPQSGLDEDEIFAQDTDFVVNAMNESYQSLRKLVSKSK